MFVVKSDTVRVGKFGESETRRLSPSVSAAVNFFFFYFPPCLMFGVIMNSFVFTCAALGESTNLGRQESSRF